MLSHILSQEDYAVCLTPGFFRFYAHIGVLHALKDAGCLRVSHVTGSSAGALIGAFLASGMEPADMAERVLAIRRKDIWDVGGIGGLLKGELFEAKVSHHLPVQTFEEAKIPLAVTAFDLLRLRTSCITEGSLAHAARASCTFPGLLQPTIVNGSPHIDGGVWDHDGMMSLGACFRADKERRGETSVTNPLAPNNKLIVNVVFDNVGSSKLPAEFSNCRLLTVVVENIPGVTPFTMDSAGPKAYQVARAAMCRALESAHMMELSSNHWCCYVDGALVVDQVAMPPPGDARSVSEGTHPSLDPHSIPPNRTASLSSVTTAVLNGDDGMETTQITVSEDIDAECEPLTSGDGGESSIDRPHVHKHTMLSGTIEFRHPHVDGANLGDVPNEAVRVHTSQEEEAQQDVQSMADLADEQTALNTLSHSSAVMQVPLPAETKRSYSEETQELTQPSGSAYAFINSRYQLNETSSMLGSVASETFASSSSASFRPQALDRKRKSEDSTTSLSEKLPKSV